jgi:FKBP-type peptidyl-prolyl cis-trans isomerase FkpA
MATIPPSSSKPVNWMPFLYIALGVVAGVLLTIGFNAGMKAWKASHTPDAVFLAKNRSGDKTVVETKSGLQYKILTAGKGGPKPTDTDVALVTYEGKLTDGTVFDKSQRPTPMKVSEVVPGFSEAMKLMPKGSKYRFWIKPSLGYGEKAAGPIPANSVLVFDVEMLDFLPEAVIRQMQEQQQQMQMRGGAAPTGGPPAGAPPAP